jgi:hypothetical protein
MLLAGALLAAACGDNLDGRGTYAADAAIEEGEAMGGALADQAGDELDEANPELALGQLGAILLAFDDGEVAQAEVELDLGSDRGALDFAAKMRDEHSLHADAVSDLLFVRRVSPVESAVSGALRGEAAAGIAELQRALLAEVDFTYLRLQVKMHAAGEVLVGGLIDLTPGDEEIASFLEATRGAIAEHRAEAEALLRAR